MKEEKHFGHFGLEFFFSQKLLYLDYPTEKTALFYTIFIQYIPLCNCNGHLEFLLGYVQVNLNIFIGNAFYTGFAATKINHSSYLDTCEWDTEMLNGYFEDVDRRVVYHCLYGCLAMI